MKDKRFRFLSLVGLLCMLMISCNRKKIDWNEGSSGTGTFQTNQARKIYASIDSMDEKAWDKAIYIDLKETIDFYTGRQRIVEADKDKLLKYLHKVYCDILIRDASGILEYPSCETEHSLLRSLYTEIVEMHKIAVDEQLNPIKERIETHNRIINYAIGNVSPNAVDSQYDLSFVDNVLSQKSDFEKENFPCEGIKRKLNSIPSELNRRHVNFINELVGLYTVEDKYNQATDNAIRKEIDKYYFDNTGAYRQYGVNAQNAAQLMTAWIDELKKIQNKST